MAAYFPHTQFTYCSCCCCCCYYTTIIFIPPYSLWLLSWLVPPSSASESSDLMALYKLVFNFNFITVTCYY